MRFALVSVLLTCSLLLPVFSAQKLTLSQSLQIAYDNSPVMLKAVADLDAAKGSAGQIVANYLPQLSVSGSIGRYYSAPTQTEITVGGTPQAFVFGVDEQANTDNYSASLSQTIFAGGRILSSISMANKGLQIAEQEYKRVMQGVQFDVIKVFYDMQKMQKMVELGEESLSMAVQHLDYVESMQKVGMVTKADVLRGKVQLANAQISLTKSKQGVELAKNAFNQVLGLDLDTPVELNYAESEFEDIQLYSYADLLNIAYSDRPDWKQYELSAKVAEDEVGVAVGGLFPALSLVGNYQVGSIKYSQFDANTRTWTAVVSGNWNLFDGSATFNKIKEARAKLAAQKANEINVRRQVALDVKNANFMLKSAVENLAAAKTAEDLAKENYDTAELRYRSGLASNLEEIDAQVAFTQAKITYLDAQHEWSIAKARVNKVVGREIY